MSTTYKVSVLRSIYLLTKEVADLDFAKSQPDIQRLLLHYRERVDKEARFTCSFSLPFVPTKDCRIRLPNCAFDVGPFKEIVWYTEDKLFVCTMAGVEFAYDQGASYIQAVENYSKEEGWKRKY